MQDKQSLRNDILTKLKRTPRPQITVFEFPQSTLLAYIPMKTEVDVIPLIDFALENGKTVAVPTQDPHFFAVIDSSWKDHLVTFKDKSCGVSSDTLLDISCIKDALLLVPGLAFTLEGARLGRGSGFYDRVLTYLAPEIQTIGICRHCQIVPSLPVLPHDKPVSKVLSF